MTVNVVLISPFRLENMAIPPVNRHSKLFHRLRRLIINPPPWLSHYFYVFIFPASTGVDKWFGHQGAWRPLMSADMRWSMSFLSLFDCDSIRGVCLIVPSLCPSYRIQLHFPFFTSLVDTARV